MTAQLSLPDRLRIERVVWSLDQRLYDLPRTRRLAIRREVRDNLRTAAADVGARRAVHNVGDAGKLASGYLDAHFGTRPRASWYAAAAFLFAGLLIAQSVLTDAANGFGKGVLAGDPGFTGSAHWTGVSVIQTSVTATGADHGVVITGGALSVWGYLLLAVGAAAVGRLWRAIPRRSVERADG